MRDTWSTLIVDDDPAIRQSLRLCLEAEHAQVQQAGTATGCLDLLDRSRFDVVFLDLWLGSDSGLGLLPEILRRQPGVGVIVITAYASYETAVEAMKLGAVDYLPKPFTPEQVRTAARRVVTAGLLRRRLTELQDRLDESEGESSFATFSPAYAAFLQTAARAAASDAVVLLRGESGTGKTVLARWIRRQSRRPDGPFVTVHCPMLSNELMSSVLFGHKRGAFTGAVAVLPNPAENRARRDDGRQRMDGLAELSGEPDRSPLLGRCHRDSLRQPCPEDFVLDLKVLDLPGKHLVGGRGQYNEKRLEQAAHGAIDPFGWFSRGSHHSGTPVQPGQRADGNAKRSKAVNPPVLSFGMNSF